MKKDSHKEFQHLNSVVISKNGDITLFGDTNKRKISFVGRVTRANIWDMTCSWDGALEDKPGSKHII